MMSALQIIGEHKDPGKVQILAPGRVRIDRFLLLPVNGIRNDPGIRPAHAIQAHRRTVEFKPQRPSLFTGEYRDMDELRTRMSPVCRIPIIHQTEALQPGGRCDRHLHSRLIASRVQRVREDMRLSLIGVSRFQAGIQQTTHRR